ncbi:hypothetical protein EAG_01900 [Camponotus floridanus]|uniref:Uncharacterized protein n=1 Tax=Camponotus floridanus TaxID=104421 RepID=E1ZZ02_CAMFO|nr:hypothetical protein EAG_01900 [Camponotus floridanus]
MEVDEDHMEVDEDHVLSADSDCISDCSENSTEYINKKMSGAEINALKELSKFCTIYFYYSADGALAVCPSCMIALQDLVEGSRQVGTLGEFFAWLQHCEEFIEELEEQSRFKGPRLSIGSRQSLVAKIARLESVKTQLQTRFIPSGGDYSGDNNAERLVWREIDTDSHILTGVVINANYIERQFLENAEDTVLEQDVIKTL